MGKVKIGYSRGPNEDAETLELAINGERPDFIVRTEDIADWAVDHVEPRLLDLLEIAGAVFAADGSITRGGLSRPGFGERWRRALSFTIEVRDFDFWRQRRVREALAETVAFLTDDTVAFNFVQTEAFTPKQDYLRFFGAKTKPICGAHVALFSGGLDSLAGALEILERGDGRVILVTHRSAQKIITRQNRLADELKRRYPGRVAYVPIKAHRKDNRAPETTQRSRSFLFMAFGYVIARIVGLNQLSFYENGVVSQNLHLSPMIIGTMATRTTHSSALLKFEELLALVEGSPFTVANPFEWSIKKEIVEKIRDCGGEDLIADSVSCNHVWGRSQEKPHCGACSQCLDRRFAILAAGLEHCEPDDDYETPVLRGERTDERSRAMALSWTRRAREFADMDASAFMTEFGGDLARLARGYPRLNADDVIRRSHAMHARHGAAVRSVLHDWTGRELRNLLDERLPGSCLLRTFVASATADPHLAEIPGRDGVTMHGVEDMAFAGALPDGLFVKLDGDGETMEFTVGELGTVTGRPAGAVFALHPQHAEDRAAGMAPAEYRYTPAGGMIPLGGASKEAVAQNVRRCRKRLADMYEAVHGEPPGEDMLIQNRRQKGYRLDPKTWVERAG